MRQRVQDLVKRGDGLFTKRIGMDSLWQTIAENFHVMRADFTRVRYPSEEFGSFLMTGRPAMAHRDLTNAIPAMMRPRDRQWLWARTDEEKINDDRECRGYLDWASRGLYRAMYARHSGLVEACKEADGDWSAFGNAVLTVDPNRDRNGLLVRAWHLRDVAWTEGDDRRVNQVHHRMKLAARDICGRWPKTVDANVTTACKDEPDREFNIRRIVIPVDDYDSPVRNKARTPFVSIYVDTDHQCILEEVAKRSRGYVIPRWARVSGSQYAYSAACIYALPDARLLQQITLTMLEAAQKATDPPMIAASEALQGGVNIGSAMITYIDADYDERTGEALRPLEMRFDGIKFGAEREERVTAQLDAVFFLNQLRFPQITKEMTAYESSKLYEEFVRNASPLLEPIEVDYNSEMCSAAFDELQALINPATGAPYFGSAYDVPELLRGRDLRWEFDTPLKQAAEQAKVFAFSAATDIAAKAGQIDPTVLLNTDWDKGYREAQIGAGGADWLLPEEQVAQAKAKRAQAAQAAQAANAIAHGADTATRVATAVQSAAQAGDAMRQSGAA